ncbi:MAG: SurA N-terminal domain-containing protein [Dysgonamonadaceae bacterium]|jgi:peptidyl-prolyl cis-trans isomerase D|nr:SurA N-terminal domain-containing protein [Dysgonamonadaceae bacterium]
MATLQKIRNKGGILVAIIGIALLAFILGDLLTSGTTIFNKVRDKAFVANGEIISTQDYFSRVSEWEEFQKTVSNRSSLDESATMQIREMVYEQMVREILLGDQAKKLGLTISKEELNDLVYGENISPLLQQLPFFVDPQTGVFNRNTLMEFLSTVTSPARTSNPQEQQVLNQYKSMWLFIENMIKFQRLEEKYNTLLSNAVMVNDSEAKTAFDLSQQNADIAYAVQNYFVLPDSAVTVSNDEIRAFYNKHKEDFKLNVPVAKITYFTKEIIPSDADFADVEKQANEAADKLGSGANPAQIVADYSDVPYRDIYVAANLLTPEQQEFVETAAVSAIHGPLRDGNVYNIYKLIDKTVAPDSIHLSIMAIPDAVGQDSLVTRFVDSLYTEIKGGKTFAEVANSINPQSNGGDIGWVREVDLASATPAGTDLVKAIFKVPVGELTKLKLSGQQVIFQVEGKSKPVQKYKLVVVSMPVSVSEKTSNNADNELNQFVSDPQIKNDFAKLASEKGYSVVPDFRVSANDFSLGQINNSRQVLNWAFNEKAKAIKKFDLTNLRIVAQVNEITPAGYTPISEVASNIRARLVKDKKAEKMIADLKAANPTSLEAYAEAMKSSVDTVKFVNFNTQNIMGLGFEPALNAYSAFAPENKLMGPVRGNLGVIVVSVSNRTTGDATFDANVQKNTMKGNNAYRFQMQSMEVLKNKLKVEDYRYRFF